MKEKEEEIFSSEASYNLGVVPCYVFRYTDEHSIEIQKI